MGAKAPTFFRGAPEFRFSVILTRRALFSSWPHAKTRVLSEGSAPFPEPNPREPSVRDAAALRLEIKWNFYGKSTPFPSSENTDSLKARSPESTQISRVSHPRKRESEGTDQRTSERTRPTLPPISSRPATSDTPTALSLSRANDLSGDSPPRVFADRGESEWGWGNRIPS